MSQLNKTAESYGNGLIGPPTFAEHFSIGLRDLLLSTGIERGDRREMFIPPPENIEQLKINDYHNGSHSAFPRDNWVDYGSVKEMQRGFYAEGHIPAIKISAQFSETNYESYMICRPADIIVPSMVSDWFLKYLPEDAQTSLRPRIIHNVHRDGVKTRAELSDPLDDRVIQETLSFME